MKKRLTRGPDGRLQTGPTPPPPPAEPERPLTALEELVGVLFQNPPPWVTSVHTAPDWTTRPPDWLNTIGWALLVALEESRVPTGHAFKTFDCAEWRKEDDNSKSQWVERALASLPRDYPWSVQGLTASTLVVGRLDIAANTLLHRMKKDGFKHVLRTFMSPPKDTGGQPGPRQAAGARDAGVVGSAGVGRQSDHEAVVSGTPGGERDKRFIRPVISAGVGESTPTDTHTGRVVPGSYRDTNPGDRYEPLPGSSDFGQADSD